VLSIVIDAWRSRALGTMRPSTTVRQLEDDAAEFFKRSGRAEVVIIGLALFGGPQLSRGVADAGRSQDSYLAANGSVDDCSISEWPATSD